jgi:hypothetical protein
MLLLPRLWQRSVLLLLLLQLRLHRVRNCTAAEPHTSIRQHTSTYVGLRPHTSAYVRIRQHTSAYVSIRQHTSAYVSIRQHTSAYRWPMRCSWCCSSINAPPGQRFVIFRRPAEWNATRNGSTTGMEYSANESCPNNLTRALSSTGICSKINIRAA